MTFSTVPMISTPISTPKMRALPPCSETPPSTHAEITSSSKPCAAFGWPLVMREARIKPASAVTSPCSRKIHTRSRSTRTPAKRAASGLPPMASVLRPKMVWFSSTPNTKKQPPATQIGNGRPNRRASPMLMNDSLAMPTACPCETMKARPRTISMVAKVAISALTRR